MDRRRFLGLAAATVFLGPDLARAARPQLLAAATCDADGRLAVVEVHAGRVVGFVPTLPDPRSIERVGLREALVCHTAAGAVSILDTATRRIRRVIHGFAEPRYTASHPDRRHAFVTDSGTRELVSVDLARGRVVGRVRLDEWARHVTIDPAGRTLWVGLGTASERVAVVDVSDPRRLRLERMIRPPFLAHDVGFEPGGDRVWVTSGNRHEVAVYDTRGRIRLRLAAGAPPQHVTFAGDTAYVTSGADGSLSAVSTVHGRAFDDARVAVGSYNVQSGRNLVLTPSLDNGTLSVLDRRGRLLRAVRVASSSHDACFLA